MKKKTIFTRLFLNNRLSWLFSIALSIISNFYLQPAIAAERLAFSYPPFGEFYININDLEILATEDKITKELAFFTNRLTPEQLEQFKFLLSRKIEFNPLAIYKFMNSPIGEIVLKNLGTAIKADYDKNGFLSLRAAIVQATFDDEGLTLINMLNKFPLKTIYLDTSVVIHCIEEGANALKHKESIIAAIQQESQTQLELTSNSQVIPELDLNLDGSFSWKKITLEFRNPDRPKPSDFDFYLPQSEPEISSSFPIIIISHGLASNRNTFSYLAKHLASQGFAVAVPEHIGTNSEQFQEILSGLAKPPEATNLINRPQDIKYLLDKLEQESTTNQQLKDKLNLQQVGIIGQSLGGYTALAAGGAEHNRAELKRDCQGAQHDNVFFDISKLIQCRVNDLPAENYQLQDPRIKAILAINPITSKIFGKEGLEKIQVPTMIVSGANDIITPPIQEQIYPFTWLNTPDKYFILVKNGTHFSFLEEGKGVLPIPTEFIGPDPEFAYPALKVLSTAFFQKHIADQAEYNAYLHPAYIQSLSNQAFELFFLQSLTENQLQKVDSFANE